MPVGTQVHGLIADALSTDPETNKSEALAIAEDIEECLVSLAFLSLSVVLFLSSRDDKSAAFFL